MEGKKTNLLRPRIVIYSLLLIGILSGVIYSIETRDAVELNVLRDRNALYREDYEGTISNTYTIKILNMDTVDHTYSLKVTGIEGIKTSIKDPIHVNAGQVLEMPLQLSADPDTLHTTSINLTLSVQATDDASISTESEGRFIGPLEP